MAGRPVDGTFKARVFNSISEFKSTFSTNDASTALRINDSLPILMRWVNRGANITLVVFSAAITRRSVLTVPVFSGWNLTKDLSCNVLMVSDPSLVNSQDLNLGWYLGSSKQVDLPHKLLDIFESFSCSRLIFFGASGGGFASLFYSASFEDSLAIVSNPQTDIKRFSYYQRYLELAWNHGAQLPEDFLFNTSLLNLYGSELNNNFIYIQNSEDYDHMENHYLPFRSKFGDRPQGLFITRPLGAKHIGPDVPSFHSVLRASTGNSDWSQLKREIEHIDLQSTMTAPKVADESN